MIQFVKGYNGCVMTYGQTSSGKSYTIMNDEGKGVVPFAISDVFQMLEQKKQGGQILNYQLYVSQVQLYNELLLDMLNDNNSELRIKQVGEISVENLRVVQIANIRDFYEALKIGARNAKIHETKMNEFSSRSHSLIIL